MSSPSAESPAEPIHAATVVVTRDGPDGPEVLLLRRDRNLSFAGGMWVFPGGRVDAADRDAADPANLPAEASVASMPDYATDPAHLAAARLAAAREAAEEADLTVDAASLVWFSHWLPPAISPKRFATWFFVASTKAESDTGVTVDGGEITEHAWMRPVDAHRRRNAGEIELAPPTWITLDTLAAFASTDAMIEGLRAAPAQYFATRFASIEGGAVALYDGDEAYDDVDHATGEVNGDPLRPGRRNRLWMLQDGWRYERD